MNGSATHTPLPRLRLTKTNGAYDDSSTPLAGPSRLSTHHLHPNDDDDDDTQSTPRIPVSDDLNHDPLGSSQSTMAGETPAARLRALLALAPNRSTIAQQRAPYSTASSEPDSDFDPPDASYAAIHAAPSFAQESIKDLFSRALRPSNTPQKTGRRRSSSIDASDAEISSARALGTGRSKRKSLSDDEADKLKRSGRLSISRDMSLDTSSNTHMDPHAKQAFPSADSDDAYQEQSSQDTASLLQHLENSKDSPPAATSTPLKNQASIQMPSMASSQSNLLDQDSEMHRAMNGMDSFAGDGLSRRAPPSFSTLRTPNSASPKRPTFASNRHSLHEKTLSRMSNQDLSRRHSADISELSSHLGSEISAADSKDSQRSLKKERTHEREREWNKPHPRPRTPSYTSTPPKHTRTPSLSESHTLTAAHMAEHNSLPRRRSDSNASIDSGSAGSQRSRTGSVMSHVSYREHVKELDDEVARERERLWNAPAHSLARKHSGLLNIPGERARTLSTPSRPSSRVGQSSHHRDSLSIPRPSSRASMHGTEVDEDEDMEVEHEVEHERERNWNAHHVKWGQHPHHPHSRASSPLPTSPPAASSSHSHSHGHRLHRHSSISSVGSRTSSRASTDRSEELEEEVEQERERNWNAPRPKWGLHTPSRASSPFPTTPPASVSTSSVARSTAASAARASLSPSPHHTRTTSTSSHLTRPTAASAAHARVRAESLKSPPSPTHARTISTTSSLMRPTAASAAHAAPRVRADSLKSPSPNAKPPATTTPGSAGKRPVFRNSGDRSSSSSSMSTPSRPAGAKGKQPVRVTEQSPKIRVETPDSPSLRKGPIARKGGLNGWQFPRPLSLPPMELEEESEPEEDRRQRTLSTPLSARPVTPNRPSSAMSTASHASRIPVKSPGKGSPGKSGGAARAHKGHRRVSTEYAESVGAIPPLQINVNGHAARLGDGDDENELHDSDLESPSPGAVATPTITPIVIPFPNEALATPPRSPEDASLSRVEQRSQKARDSPPLPPAEIEPMSPLPSPPSDDSRPPSVLVTPPRAMASPRPVFETPPAPKGMPELPEPPSDDDDTMELPPRTPMRFGNANFSAMQTPRPPGAWAATPVAPRHEEARPPESGDESTDSGLATPAASLSRGSSLPVPPQTPAPPGGWVATPFTNRKSVFKVRFDVESSATEQSVSGEMTEPEPEQVATQPATPEVQPVDHAETTHATDISHLEFRSMERVLNGAPVVDSPIGFEDKSSTPQPGTTELPVTPAPQRPATPRRSASVRLVDAYGREQSIAEQAADVAAKALEVAPPTPRSKSGVRILDAMGREVEETVDMSMASQSEDDSLDLSHNEALARVRASVAQLAVGLDEVDRSFQKLDLRDPRLVELETASLQARKAREELQQKLAQTVGVTRAVENDLKSKYSDLRASVRQSKLIPSVANPITSWWSLPAYLFWTIVIVQFVLVIIMYRMTATNARQMFLTTYYDPFHHDIHLHTVRPDLVRSMSDAAAPGWSLLSVPGTVQKSGVRGAMGELWGNVTGGIQTWQRGTWDMWGSSQPSAWPPT